MKRPTRNRAARAGYTLIELAITVGIAGIVLGAVARVFDSSKNAYGQGSASAQVQNESRRALDRVASELENAGFGTLLPNPVGMAADDVVFQVTTGVNVNTGAIIFGNSNRLRFIYEPGEANNGLDDDNDGLIDEGCIELTRNYLQPGQQTVTLAHGISEFLEGETSNGLDDNGNGLIDERGFCMTRVGNLLRLRITMSRPVFDGNAALATVETALRLKN